jgi:Family of unknown function (DUF6049)
MRPLGVLLVASALMCQLPTASAQDGTAEIALLRQPVWHDGDDRLNLKLRITNTSDVDLKGFNIVVGSSYRVTTRSGLHTIFDPDSFESVSSLPLPLAFPNLALPPGATHDVVVGNPVAELGLVAAGEPGVYPLKITLQDSAGISLDSLATQVLYYPERPETRLGIVPLVTLNDTPARRPDGTFAPGSDGAFPLEEALAENGWLTVAAAALGRGVEGGMRAALAPTPRLLEEVADLSDGYARTSTEGVEEVPDDSPVARRADAVLGTLRAAVSSGSLQPVKIPYSAPDLPSITAITDGVTGQLAAGSAALVEVFGEATGGRAWAYAPSGRLDAEALEQISGAGVERTFFAPNSLEESPNPDEAGCPVRTFSFTCAVEVSTELGGSLSGFMFDPFLQEHLGEVQRPTSAAPALQRFFAETAMIREELPGTPDRVIAAAIPATSRTSARITRSLIIGLARAPWLETMTPGQGLNRSATEVTKQIVEAVPVLDESPPDAYLTETQAAGETVAQFGSLQPPANLIRRLGRNVLVAQSRALWSDPALGLEYARASVNEVEREFAKIGIVAPDEITLTSKRGEFQFILVNDTGYDVSVDVAMTSDKLDLPDPGAIDVAPGQRRVTVRVTTESSGIFPLTVQLLTPDGFEISEAKPITVRSTEFNEIALGVIFGALAFVVIFYVVRGIRRRRNRREPRAGTIPV